MIATALSAVPWEQLTVGVAAVLAIVLVTRSHAKSMEDVQSGLDERTKLFLSSQEAARAQNERQTQLFLDFTGNHVSEMSKAVTAGATAMERVADRLEKLENSVDGHVAKMEATVTQRQEQLARIEAATARLHTRKDIQG